DFNIVVSNRVFGFSTAFQNITVSPGIRFRSLSFRPFLSLDGQPVTDGQLASVNADAPEWVEFDKEDLSLSGIPDDPVNVTVIISVMDIYGNTANAMVLLSVGDGTMQLGSLAAVNVTAGEYFSYTLSSPAFSPSTKATAALGTASSWLGFDSHTWTLSGEVPSDLPAQTLSILVTFENATMT